MDIKDSVKNTFKRIGLDWENYNNTDKNVEVVNRFGAGSCITTELIAECIRRVYQISNAYERGDNSVKVSDFDRVRYFVLAQDNDAYMTCID